ncbi:MAG TPA: tRNA dihydrouridine(20/20a) synthase DusA, partial [Casimicrobiaceae bacterium]|nr:tRNA dihydrouridine(20/20a) synthase DusA [Casimicrobiaceae bacterium]
DAMIDYIDAECVRGTSLRSIARHMLGLYHGIRGGRQFRQMLSDAARLAAADSSLLLDAQPLAA